MCTEIAVETIRVGNIVRVICPDLRFTDKQGVVMEINQDGNGDGPIGVRFPTWYTYLFNDRDKADTIVRFESEDLCVEGRFDELPDKTRVERTLGSVWQGYKPILPLIPGDTDCVYEGCQKKAWFSILVNCWGTASELYVCGDHACDHRKRLDMLPRLKK